MNTAAPKMWCAPQAPGYNITETHDRCKDEQFYCGWKLTCTAGFHPKVCHRPMIGIGYWAAWNDCMVGTMLPLMSTRTCNGCWWISGDNCPSQYVQAFGQFYQTMTSWTVSRMTHWNIVVFIIVQNGLYGFTDKSTPKHATTCQSLMLYHVHSHNPYFQRVNKANECRWRRSYWWEQEGAAILIVCLQHFLWRKQNDGMLLKSSPTRLKCMLSPRIFSYSHGIPRLWFRSGFSKVQAIIKNERHKALHHRRCQVCWFGTSAT